MAIKMQGLWLVKVKSKSAAFPQQFQISGATSGNGIYSGTHSGEVTVTGNNWTITVRHNPGDGFRTSQVKLIPPFISGGFHKFDIQTNDSGGDQDFNDLILTCRTPVTASDYLIYGKVTDYQGLCLLNPCNPLWVLDSVIKLKEALKIPALKEYLTDLYPDRVKAALKYTPLIPAGFDPQPEPPKFVPMVIPRPGELATPLKQKFLVQTEEQKFTPEIGKVSGKTSAKATPKLAAISFTGISSIKALPTVALPVNEATQQLRRKLELGIFKPSWICDKDPLANTRVRFYEYDRTPAELSGEAYTGTGNRKYLGSTFTDDFGNYIFKFSVSLSDTLDEVTTDIATGENASVQVRPDIIAQVMQPLNPFELACETAPFWNIPQQKRLNICIPRSKVGIRPMACDGQHILQGVGNVVLGKPNPDGSRTGFSNVLTNTGIITSKNSLGPTTDCYAWNGSLILRGCLNNPKIKYYTLESRRPGEGWRNLDISFTLPRFFGALQLNQQINTGTEVNGNSVYLNAETHSGDWLNAFVNIKAKFSTHLANFGNGTNYIRIIGLDKDKKAVAGVSEILRLYILNNRIELDIDPEVEMMGGGTISECGLFVLPAGQERAPIKVRFKATQGNVPPAFAGFMEQYFLYVQKGSSLPAFSVDKTVAAHNAPFTTVPEHRGRKYVPAAGGGLSCDLSFFGTADEPSEVNGYIEVTLTPDKEWLKNAAGNDQDFCTFGLELHGRLRRTNGQSTDGMSRAVPVLFGIQRPRP